mmetsp:Transcript_26378/g.75744  ORF Transcript_26378/g.75744 Transcript_26378/m.75744 type:complete len:723 (+) Transcript_26378:333-2501(+)
MVERPPRHGVEDGAVTIQVRDVLLAAAVLDRPRAEDPRVALHLEHRARLQHDGVELSAAEAHELGNLQVCHEPAPVLPLGPQRTLANPLACLHQVRHPCVVAGEVRELASYEEVHGHARIPVAKELLPHEETPFRHRQVADVREAHVLHEPELHEKGVLHEDAAIDLLAHARQQVVRKELQAAHVPLVQPLLEVRGALGLEEEQDAVHQRQGHSVRGQELPQVLALTLLLDGELLEVGHGMGHVAHEGGEDDQARKDGDDGVDALPGVRWGHLHGRGRELRHGPVVGGGVVVEQGVLRQDGSRDPARSLPVELADAVPAAGHVVVDDPDDHEELADAEDGQVLLGVDHLSQVLLACKLHYPEQPGDADNPQYPPDPHGPKHARIVPAGGEEDHPVHDHQKQVQEEPARHVAPRDARGPKVHHAADVGASEEGAEYVHRPNDAQHPVHDIDEDVTQGKHLQGDHHQVVAHDQGSNDVPRKADQAARSHDEPLEAAALPQLVPGADDVLRDEDVLARPRARRERPRGVLFAALGPARGPADEAQAQLLRAQPRRPALRLQGLAVGGADRHRARLHIPKRACAAEHAYVPDLLLPRGQERELGVHGGHGPLLQELGADLVIYLGAEVDAVLGAPVLPRADLALQRLDGLLALQVHHGVLRTRLTLEDRHDHRLHTHCLRQLNAAGTSWAPVRVLGLLQPPAPSGRPRAACRRPLALRAQHRPAAG